MQYLRYLLLTAIALILIVIAMANRGFVNISLLPADLGTLIGFNRSISLPLFVVILFGVAFGLMIGFVMEWVREIKYRNAHHQEHKQVIRLKREIRHLKSEQSDERTDDILALIDNK